MLFRVLIHAFDCLGLLVWLLLKGATRVLAVWVLCHSSGCQENLQIPWELLITLTRLNPWVLILVDVISIGSGVLQPLNLGYYSHCPLQVTYPTDV